MTKRPNLAIFLLTFTLLTLLAPTPNSNARTSNDPLLLEQWGFEAIGLAAAWDSSFGGNDQVLMAVIDSGFNPGINDFAETNVQWSLSWDFWDNDGDVRTAQTHGEHVAGTMAQSTNNVLGAAGIAFNCRLVPFKIFSYENDLIYDDDVESYEKGVAAAIDRAVEVGAEVVNMSIGIMDPFSPVVQDACRRAYEAGVLLVTAAGNSRDTGREEDQNASAPANMFGCLPVGALKRDLELEYWSQYPYSDLTGYGLTAPGVDILQVTHKGNLTISGTSMASPMVAGVAGLVLSRVKDLGLDIGQGSAKVDWLKDVLFSTAQDLGEPGPDRAYGYGMVRADRALQEVNKRSGAN